MGLVFLLNLLAWPLITLVYPLYASIQAIERDSHVENRKWLTYWVLCGLVMLFELTATKFFEWIPFWPQIKLMVALWLVAPQFNGAVYAYNNFVRPCFSVNPNALGHFLRSPKQDQFRNGNSEDFLLVAERYVKEKGPEALENIIFGKVKYVESNPTVENSSVASTVDKDDEDAPKNKQDSAFDQIDYKEISGTENNTKFVVEVVGGGSESILSQSSASDEAQKEWTCALCQVSMHSKAILHNHLQGRRHKAKEKKLIEFNLAQTVAPAESKPTYGAEVVGGGCERPESSIINAQKEWTCALCQICTPSEEILRNHLQGKKHKTKEKELMEKQMERIHKTPSASIMNTDNLMMTPKKGVAANMPVHKYVKKTEEKKENTDITKFVPKDGGSAYVPVFTNIKKPEDKRENVGMPKVISNKGVLGKYVKQPEELRGKIDKPKVLQKEAVQGKHLKKPEEKRSGGTGTGGHCAQTNLRNPEIVNKSSELWCDVCQLQCNSSSMLIDHLRGKRHLASAQGV